MRKTLSNIDLSMSSEPADEMEVFPGIHERRYFLRGSLATVAAIVALRTTPKSLLAQTPIKSTGAAAGVDGLAWDDFLKQSVPIAQQLIADPAFSVDEYLYRIGSLATRLKEIPNSALGSYKTVEPRVWFGPSFRGSPFLFSGAWNRALYFPHTTTRMLVFARLALKVKCGYVTSKLLARLQTTLRRKRSACGKPATK